MYYNRWCSAIVKVSFAVFPFEDAEGAFAHYFEEAPFGKEVIRH